MTSQQPATEPGAAPAHRQGEVPAEGRPAAGVASRVAPVVLLVVLIVIGLRGQSSRLAWEGPLHRAAEIVGIVLEVILGTLLVITLRRRKVESTDNAQKLRTGLQYLLSAAMIALGVALLVNAHLHLNTKFKPLAAATAPAICARPPCKPHTLPKSGGGGTALQGLLYILLIAVIITIIILVLRHPLAFRRTRAVLPYGPIATDAETLRDAIDEGAAALRAGAFDDARKAIIACYVAMEGSLADRGAARSQADTPDELLSRATAAGIIRGTGAARLTTLFYEARFSTHPLADDKRDQARLALDEIAASLAQAPAETPAEPV